VRKEVQPTSEAMELLALAHLGGCQEVQLETCLSQQFFSGESFPRACSGALACSREAGKQQEKQAQATLAYNMRAASRKAEELRARLVAAGAAARRVARNARNATHVCCFFCSKVGQKLIE
jgi:hypothetical protein